MSKHPFQEQQLLGSFWYTRFWVVSIGVPLAPQGPEAVCNVPPGPRHLGRARSGGGGIERTRPPRPLGPLQDLRHIPMTFGLFVLGFGLHVIIRLPHLGRPFGLAEVAARV